MPASRAAMLQALGEHSYDVLVIGGGINGAGIARDAALRGLRVALVEQDDFASGTSSRSSRLVHGGVRYLEHREFGLVFEASRERRILLRIAPHLVRPLAFTWPVYARARVRRWQLAAALTLYDALALFRNVQRHAVLSVTRLLTREPALRRQGLRGGARYYDAATDDARLTLATALAARDAGALLLTHARVESLRRDDDGRIAGGRVLDRITGVATEVRARCVVNATGPWSDEIGVMAGAPRGERVRGSKGVHVTVPRERVGNVDALTLLAPQDGRVMFVLPAGDFAIIGTTDSYEDVAPADVRATAADVEYLLSAANHYLPAAGLQRGDVVAAWAGLRPLAASASGADDPGSASREHVILEEPPGLVTVTGGKLTTYRSMAVSVVDAVQRALGEAVTEPRTAELPLPGGEGFDISRETAEATRETGDAEIASRLVHAQGTAWRAVWQLAEGALAERIDPTRPYVVAELAHAVAHEMALTLGDLLIRRVPLAFELRDNGRDAARRMAPLVARWLGWSEGDVAAMVADYDAEVSRIFAIDD